jgi:hypothetical protein
MVPVPVLVLLFNEPALRTCSDDFVFKLFGLPPLSDAGQAEAVGTARQDTESAIINSTLSSHAAYRQF